MPPKNDRSWLRQRLDRRAKDARQAQRDAFRFWSTAYPDARHLAQVHSDAAEVYERALAELDKSECV